jgi:hypothetical protein
LSEKAIKTEYAQLHTILMHARSETEALFHHGLLFGERREAALLETAEQLMAAGLTAGAELTTALAEKLVGIRVDPSWTPDAAIDIFARLWRYLELCLIRLEYLEVADFSSS